MTTPSDDHERWLADWQRAHTPVPDLQAFALIDPAQDPSVLDRIQRAGCDHACPFGYAIDAAVARVTPRLVRIEPETHADLLRWLLRRMVQTPCATLLAATCNLQALQQHLQKVVDVHLEGVDSMFLAFWDPAILGTLLGVTADDSLHVPGPVLSDAQRDAFLGPVAHWWYVDRRGRLHDALAGAGNASPPRGPAAASLPLALSPAQVDLLVEASVPDHLLHHLAANQPESLERLAPAQRYDFVQQQLARARAHGLQGMGDLVTYVSVALASGARFDETPTMQALLAQVRQGQQTFMQALPTADEAELARSAVAPSLL